MHSSPPSETIRYGLQLLWLPAFTFIAGGLAIGIGISVGGTRPVLATVVVLAGLAVMFTGGMATLYKVIRDGVSAGRGPSVATDGAGEDR